MTALTSAPRADETRTLWTCPFCPLLCDSLAVRADASGIWTLQGDCPHAQRGLAAFRTTPADAQPMVGGKPCSLDDAVAAAAQCLGASRQPLFGGLGTDVAGARALYRLACRTGAISDAAASESALHLLRARQDRGGYFTTLAEIRNRADVIVCLGGIGSAHGTSLWDRFGVGEALVAPRHVVILGPGWGDDELMASLAARDGVSVETIPLTSDVFDTLALLSAAVSGRAGGHVPPAIAALADRLKAAHYAVFAGVLAALPTHGSLIVEAVHQIVATLNLSSRAGSFWIGRGDGGGTVDEVFTWLSGLPLRSRAGPRGLEHEPVCFDSARLVADGAVDAGLWVSAFDGERAPPGPALPWVVVGHPALARIDAAVFIPVSTPGIGSTGHLFRSDGGVVLPLSPLYADSLPTVAEVIHRIDGAMNLKVRAA